ncbi:MAG: FtsX-like permease family protein [Slackia sp.]|nr:FtsX-like permease family protein [Slackia sp.]
MLVKLAFANVRKSARDFAVYFFTLVLGIAVFYAFNSIAGSDAVARISEDSRSMVELLSMTISAVSIFVAAVLAFLVLYANRFLIRRRNKEFGLYLTLGMRKGDLMRLAATETFVVGAASLIVGLAIGIVVSQGLSNAAASLFDSSVEGVAFSVSGASLVQTVLAFSVIFAITVALNTGHLFKAKLIDLLQADRRNDEMRLRSLPLSFLLFIVSCVIIGVAYKLLVDNGLLEVSPEFIAATVLVCVGTVLFFYALSGFLLRVAQMIRPLYLRGLNMFFLRQLSARVNSAFLSMSVIALTLFLAMTSVCGGIGICSAMRSGVDAGTKYDASVVTTHRMYDYEKNDGTLIPIYPDEFASFVESHDYDMAAGFADSAAPLGLPAWDLLVDRSVQVDFYVSGVTYGMVEKATGESLYDYVGAGLLSDGMEKMFLDAVPVSQFNAARELAGLEAVEIGDDECLLWSDFATTAPYFDAVAQREPTLSVGGHDLKVRGDLLRDTLETTGVTQRAGVIVVPDACIADADVPYTSLLDIRCKSGQDAALADFLKAVENTSDTRTQPVHMVQTADEVRAQSFGLTAVVSYLAIYIGFVLVIACAAILAIQQLTDVADNARRYDLLAKLGASRTMIEGALFKQVSVYFLFPLILGIAHTLCAMQVVTDVVRVFGNFDIGVVSAVAVAAFLLVYGAYFLATYGAARAMVLKPGIRA